MKPNWLRFGTLALTLGVAFSALASAQVKVGDPAPSIRVTDMSGKQIFFKDMQTGGPVFIYFIRDGDSVGQQMTSYVDKIVRAYGASRSTWYGITNAKEDRARSFQAETNPAFRLVRDENLTAIKGFGVAGAPAVYEFSRRGILLNMWKGYSAVNLKSINEAVARVSRKPLMDMDFTNAPSVAQYGINYDAVTGNGG